VPHERWGEAVHAVVSVRAQAEVTADELIAHCRESLARYKVPEDVQVLAELPKNAVGKLVKGFLREPSTA